jgi:acetylxylan esterase
MSATYPEMFAAATVYSGVPAGCFLSSSNQVDAWNSTCAQGQINQSQSYWANVAKNMYPGYTGSRPKMTIYHGSVDTTLYPQNFNETMKEWSGVFGYSSTPSQTLANTPQQSYTKYVYGPSVTGIYATGVGHTVPVRENDDLAFFGITGGGSSTPGTGSSSSGGSTPTTTVSTPASTPTSGGGGSTGGATVAQWGQCGGTGYTGSTTCASPYTCHYSNPYYSQCY